ncbi:type II secretion system protein GspL [Pseudomonas sp. Marseille-Q5115]|uniref:type II secretion system protein GspL n=1 Tax=Pseudomonas sp. Marseille-Q5115 TaxID=2866593 RepID=UPI001CE46FED|nr:PilN domain-containing protein [Pseudomonas sp. Marseille-Q5115]
MTLSLSTLRAGRMALYAAWRASPASACYQAWLHELRTLLPSAMQAWLAPAARVQRLAWPLPATLNIEQPAVLVLPASEVLVQPLMLPAGARRDVHKVLGFEIDRYTPFTVEQVHFVAQVLHNKGPKVKVLLVALSQERLHAMLDTCVARGLSVVGIDALTGDGTPLGIDLLPAAARPRNARRWSLNRGLALFTFALAIIAMVTLLHVRGAQLEALRITVEHQREAIAELETTRRELINTRGAATYLTALKAERPTLTAMLANLSECLGDDSWVQQLEVRDGGAVSLSGQSQRASALITRFKTCHTLADARFQGIIQPDTQTGNERFSLSAHLVQEAGDAPTTD